MQPRETAQPSRAPGVQQDGLRVPVADGPALDVLFDDVRVWSFDPRRDGVGPAGNRFVAWPRVLLSYLDGSVRVTVREHVGGTTILEQEVQFGSGDGRIRLVDEDGHQLTIDKDGRAARVFADADTDSRVFLVATMDDVLRVLRDDCGADAFVSYGCLLGALREGRVIGHDNDADVTVLSRYESPIDVQRESYAMERALRRRGYETRCYSPGDFKVVTYAPNDQKIGIDVFSSFYVEDIFYMFPYVSATDLPRSAILPLSRIELEGRSLPAPADPEAMMVACYGEGWRVPDPSFKHRPGRTTVRRLNGWMRGPRMHRKYWDRFYKNKAADAVPRDPSPFARWVGGMADPRSLLIDIGSGNGRDSLWFARNGFTVLGLDYSPPALVLAGDAATAEDLSAAFEQFSLYELREVLTRGAQLAHRDGSKTIYGRFLLHAIEDIGRENFWEFSKLVLAGGGRLFLEFRTGKDANAEHAFGEHFRRFLETSVVVDEIEAGGGVVEHCEEGQGMAVYGDEDPHVARLVVRWP